MLAPILFRLSFCTHFSALCTDLGGGAQNFEKWNEKLLFSDIKQFSTLISQFSFNFNKEEYKRLVF
jgi:hypothetical protein